MNTCPTCESYHPENYKGECRDDNYRSKSPFIWFSTSSGRIEFQIAEDDADTGSHSGSCDGDISVLRQVPYIAEQLSEIDPDLLRHELKEYGAWDDKELSDDDANLNRILWIACGDVADGKFN